MEADDRIMLSIHQAYLKNDKSSSITVLKPDTDILVTLLYHLNKQWQGLNLFLMRKDSALKVPGKKQWEVFPLLDVVSNFGDHVINQLPAGHALTGCDTVAKVGTKSKDSHAQYPYEYRRGSHASGLWKGPSR